MKTIQIPSIKGNIPIRQVYPLANQPLCFVLLTEKGMIYLYESSTQKLVLHSHWDTASQYKSLRFYSHGAYFCIVADGAIAGIVLHKDRSDYSKQLSRGDYHVEHCSFPIAFYEQNNYTYLIHGVEWNQLAITCLETDECLTTNRDETIEDLDYFQSLLYISPNGKQFLGNGWVWSPYDIITLYTINDFLKGYESSSSFLNFIDSSGYNWDRPLCWLNNQLIATIHYPTEESTIKCPYCELLIYDLTLEKVTRKIPLEHLQADASGDIFGELYFNQQHGYFIIIGVKGKLSLIDRYGRNLSIVDTPTILQYNSIHNSFYGLDNSNILWGSLESIINL